MILSLGIRQRTASHRAREALSGAVAREYTAVEPTQAPFRLIQRWLSNFAIHTLAQLSSVGTGDLVLFPRAPALGGGDGSHGERHPG